MTNGKKVVEPKLDRDSRILLGEFSHVERTRANKAWARSAKLGLLGHMLIKVRRDQRRGWEI